MKSPILSIVIPVYNAEQYLEDCIESILSQDFQDFELILINDGSTDGSGEVCNSYSKRDVRIRTFHKENGGVSTARNLGLAHSTGEWLYFVDADDSIVDNVFGEVFSHNLENGDIIQFGHNRIFNNKILEFKSSSQIAYFNSLDEFYNSSSKTYTLWSHFIRRSIIRDHQIVFSEGIKYAEDLEFIIKSISVSCHFIILGQIVYNYYIRESSAMTKPKNYLMALDHLKVSQNLIVYSKSQNLTHSRFLHSRIVYMIKSYFSFLSALKLNYLQIRKNLYDYQYLFNNNKDFLKNIRFFRILNIIGSFPYLLAIKLKSRYVK